MKLIKPALLSAATLLLAFLFPIFWKWYENYIGDKSYLATPLFFTFLFWIGVLFLNIHTWVESLYKANQREY